MKDVDLDIFRFDYDLTLAVLFLDGNDKVYSRWGGRDAGPGENRLSKESFLHAMRETLALHKEEWKGVDERDVLPTPKTTVQKLPWMERRIEAGKGPECFHCHMVPGARREEEVARGKFDKRRIWDFPPPENLGITFDRDQGTLVAEIAPKSPAARAGIRKGDRIESVGEVRTLTEGDVRLSLHNIRGRNLEVRSRRGVAVRREKLTLPKSWRVSDISWRASMYRIPPNPGFWAPELGEKERMAMGLAADVLALKVQWVPAGPSRKAGLRKGMVILALDGSRKRLTPNQVHLRIRVDKNPGDTLELAVLDGDRERTLKVRFPRKPRQN